MRTYISFNMALFTVLFLALSTPAAPTDTIRVRLVDVGPTSFVLETANVTEPGGSVSGITFSGRYKDLGQIPWAYHFPIGWTAEVQAPTPDLKRLVLFEGPWTLDAVSEQNGWPAWNSEHNTGGDFQGWARSRPAFPLVEVSRAARATKSAGVLPMTFKSPLPR